MGTQRAIKTCKCSGVVQVEDIVRFVRAWEHQVGDCKDLWCSHAVERLGETMTRTVQGIPDFLGGMPRLLGGVPSGIHAGFGGDPKFMETFSEGLEVVPGVSMLCTWCT